jgi:hypothetical protein
VLEGTVMSRAILFGTVLRDATAPGAVPGAVA